MKEGNNLQENQNTRHARQRNQSGDILDIALQYKAKRSIWHFNFSLKLCVLGAQGWQKGKTVTQTGSVSPAWLNYRPNQTSRINTGLLGNFGHSDRSCNGK